MQAGSLARKRKDGEWAWRASARRRHTRKCEFRQGGLVLTRKGSFEQRPVIMYLIFMTIDEAVL